MASIDELNGKLSRIQQAMASEDVKFLMGLLDDVAKNRLISDLQAKGEEAVRALGFQQGIGVIKLLPMILEQEISVKQQELRNRLKV